MAQALGKLFEERAGLPPKFDLLSMLAHGEATRNMPFREFMGTLSLLIVGGNDTTRNSMTGGLMALNEHPGEYIQQVTSLIQLPPGWANAVIAEFGCLVRRVPTLHDLAVPLRAIVLTVISKPRGFHHCSPQGVGFC